MGQVSTKEDIADKKLDNIFGEEPHIARTSSKSDFERFVGKYRSRAVELEAQERASERAKYESVLKATHSVLAAASVLKPSPSTTRLRAVINRRKKAHSTL
jgi:hypothetical protein